MTLNPLDSRYKERIAPITDCLGSDAYTKQLVFVEYEWFKYFARQYAYCQKPGGMSVEERHVRSGSIPALTDDIDIERIRVLESQLGHDIKAVEYYVKDSIKAVIGSDNHSVDQNITELVHIGCTSEDITNVAYAIGLGKAKEQIANRIDCILELMGAQVSAYGSIPMLAHTHGQPASPTTVGKELAVYHQRIKCELKHLKELPIKVKFSGATGNHNALTVILRLNPHKITNSFIESLAKLAGVKLVPSDITTQVESHDSIAAILHSITRLNNIMTDLACDMWQYIGKSYFKLKVDRVGSSTMPHKINPIEFENAEGNFGLSNSLLSFMADKLTVSRMQRDLSGSTVKRNLGVALGYAYLGYESIHSGMSKIEVYEEKLNADLFDHEEVIREAVQTFLRVNPDVMQIVKDEFNTDLGPYEIMAVKSQLPKQVIKFLQDSSIFSVEVDKYIGMAARTAIEAIDQLR
jgi:adenylosuccinate lyase